MDFAAGGGVVPMLCVVPEEKNGEKNKGRSVFFR